MKKKVTVEFEITAVEAKIVAAYLKEQISYNKRKDCYPVSTKVMQAVVDILKEVQP